MSENQLVPIQAGSRGLELRDIDSFWRFSNMVIKAGTAPKSLNTPEKVMVALQMGAEVGLTPMQSLKNIAVINGSGAMWGDALVALVRRSPLCEYIHDEWTGDNETRTAICTAKRKDDPKECVREFGYKDAKKAGLVGRDTYKAYPDRMFQCRARAWAIRDLFPDLLMGLEVAEELQDLEYTQAAQIESGDDAPLDSLDDAAELISQDAEKVPAPSEVPCDDTGKISPEDEAKVFGKGEQQALSPF
jgi:hypothetical protein